LNASTPRRTSAPRNVQFARQGQALFQQRGRGFVFAARGGQVAGRPEQLGTGTRCGLRGAQVDERSHEGVALADEPAQFPELPQRRAQANRCAHVRRRPRPVQRCADVVDLAVEEREPGRLLRSAQLRFGLFGEIGAPRQVTVAHTGFLVRGAQVFGGVLTHGLEEAVSGLCV
jgi:hypothetical protein